MTVTVTLISTKMKYSELAVIWIVKIQRNKRNKSNNQLEGTHRV